MRSGANWLAGLAMAASLAIPACAQADAPLPPAVAPDTQAAHIAELRERFQASVPAATFLGAEREAALIAHAQNKLAEQAVLVEKSQLLVVVDRNPAAQDLALVLAQPRGEWEVIGTTKVSTGQRGRFDYYITPTGVFFHTDAILGYRAEGTYNENGIRGLGLRGMRVWDFGWHSAVKGWRADGERGDIRLLMHATDPANLEQRLGRPASQGCVRIPTALNRFLDHHGVLDVDYERAAVTDVRFRGLLKPDRAATPLAGNAMVVVDTQDQL